MCSKPVVPAGASASGVYDKSEPLVLESHKLTNSGGYEQAAGNQMLLEICHNLLGCVVLGIQFTGGDLTGLPMNGLVSYEEQNPPALEALNARIGVVRVGTIGGRLIHGRVLAGEPLISCGRLASAWVGDFEDFAKTVF
jgi:hypothetical protein